MIGEGDCKRVPFLVLGLSLCYGTIFLFLEQPAPSLAAYARTCCKNFNLWMCRVEMASEIPKNVLYFLPTTPVRFNMSLAILLQYFRRELLQFAVRQCRI